MKIKLLFAAAFLWATASSSPAFGQFDIGGKIKDRLQNRAEQSVDGALDKAESAATQKRSNDEEQAEEEKSKSKSSKKDAPAGKSQQAEPALQAFSKYDFVPGEKVIFFDDFSQANVGDYPGTWNTNGSGEVVTTNRFPGKWFKMGGSCYHIAETKGDFPDNFTVEYDIIPQRDQENNINSVGFYIVSGNINDPNEGGAIPGKAGIKLSLGAGGYSYDFSTYADGEYKISGGSDKYIMEENQKYRISIWVQKQRIRVYVNENKVFDLPKAMPANFKYNILRFELSQGDPMIANFRVSVGAPDMRSKLLTEGKLVTHGIYFDSGSDKVKPESYGTLKEIANVLKENASVKVKIVGHTDTDGDDKANLDLSKRRAAAVKASLSKDFGIDASRMETDGKGEKEPISPNSTPEGKANNRRVEFIKL
ncbi:MAG: OmpA family protein [Chlorobiales bacterium]|jgi:OmpA-OmpF porin, OOP family|nr:OmpA family protein [Chlorobiales bacterium]